MPGLAGKQEAPKQVDASGTEHGGDQPDLIAVALSSIAAGAAAGAALVSAALAAFHDRLTDTLPLTIFAGLVVAVALGWTLARAVGDVWRRGVTAALAAFGTLILAGLAAPADIVAGRAGLVGYAALLAAGAVVAARGAKRVARG